MPMPELHILQAAIQSAGYNLRVDYTRPELLALFPFTKGISAGGGQFEVFDDSGKLVASFTTQRGVVDWVNDQKNQQS